MNQSATYNKAVFPNPSFMTNELSTYSPIAIVEVQNNDNQAVVNSAIMIAELLIANRINLEKHKNKK